MKEIATPCTDESIALMCIAISDVVKYISADKSLMKEYLSEKFLINQ